jgi:hypothetical protein
MSIGLAFVQGLVGGFQKNIEREQALRTADDQRLAGLQDTLFQATAKAAAEGNPVPSQLGDMLRKAKEDIANRPDIGLFGTGKAERLNLDFTGLAGTVNDVGGNYIDYGDIKIPVNENFFKGTGPGSIVSKADLYMKAMDTWLTKGNNRSILKKYMEANPNTWSKKISGDLYRYGETWSLGTAKTLAPDQKDATLIPQVKNSFRILGGFLEEVEGITPKDMKQIDMAYSTGEKLFFDEKFNASTDYTRKDSILLPFLNEKDDLVFSPYKFKNPETLAALKNIAKKNGFDNVGKFVYHFRNQTELALPQAGELKFDPFNKEGMLPEESNIATIFPSLIHAANLETLGGGKNFINMSDTEQKKVVAYLDEYFRKPDGSIDMAGRVRAVAPIIQVPESELSKFNNQYKTFEKTGTSSLKNRNETFERLVGISVKDFNIKYDANVKSINGIRQLVELRKVIPTSSGLVETFKQFFGGISAPTGQFDQAVDYLFGRGDNKEGVSTQSLRDIVQKVKKDGSILSDLSNVNEAEAIMIVLAADMARAADPSGRLSNQDFEVQLRRLGKTGFFSTKMGQFAALGTVMDDFAGRFQRIEMIKAVEIGSNNGILTPRQLQVLYANQKVIALQDKVGMSETGGGSGGITYTDEFSSSLFQGSNGETVTIKKGSDGVTYYFINGQQVDKSQIVRKGQSPNIIKDKDSKGSNKKQENNQNNLDQVAPEKITGKVVGGDKVNGLKLQGKEGLYLQNKDGTFSKKPSGTGA